MKKKIRDPDARLLTYEHNHRVLEARASLYRRLLLYAVAVAGVLAGTIGVLAFQPRFIPYVVAVDSWGVVRTIEPLEPLEHTEERFIRAELQRAVVNLRTWIDDPALLARLYEDASAYLSAAARAYVESTLPPPTPDLVSRQPRDVRILPRTESIFQVNWDEHVYRLGRAPEIERWEALLTLSARRSTITESSYLLNPFGLRIEKLSWVRRSLKESVP